MESDSILPVVKDRHCPNFIILRRLTIVFLCGTRKNSVFSMLMEEHLQDFNTYRNTEWGSQYCQTHWLELSLSLRPWTSTQKPLFRTLIHRFGWTWKIMPSQSRCNATLGLSMKQELHNFLPQWGYTRIIQVKNGTLRYIMECSHFIHVYHAGVTKAQDDCARFARLISNLSSFHARFTDGPEPSVDGATPSH